MSDWPADVEEMRKHHAPNEVGSGQFVLVTRAFVGREVREFRVTHRFQTMAGRADFREMAERFGIFESERTE